MPSSCNILYISPFFYPELISTGKYNTYLVNALVESGCKLEVICSHPLYPKWKPEVSNKTLDNVRIIRGGQFIRYPKKPLIRRLILEIWMLFFVFRHLVIFRKHYDSIIIVFPPNLVAILIPLLRSKNTRVIGLVHDIQGVMADPKMGLISSIIMKGIHAIESYSYKACNHLIFLSENMKSAARELYSISEGNTIVRYPFITINTKDSEYKLDNIFSGVKSSVVYSGALGEKQAPDKLIKIFIKLLESDPDVHAFIFSQGIVFDRIKLEYTHERLHFHPLVEEDQLPELIKRSTIQIIPQDMGTSEGAFPSKLPNIFAAGTKLFCITEKGGEIDNLLSDYSRSVLCYSWENVEESLLNFLHADLQDLSEKDNALLEKFSLSSLVDSIIAMSSQRDKYSDVASKGTP